MEQFIELSEKYPISVVLNFVLVCVIGYFLKSYFDKTLESHFEKSINTILTEMKNRSEFRQKIIMEQYALVTSLLERLNVLLTKAIKINEGKETHELSVNYEIVELTEIQQYVASKRYLLKPHFYKTIVEMLDVILRISNLGQDNAEVYYKSYEELSAKLEERIVSTFISGNV